MKKIIYALFAVLTALAGLLCSIFAAVIPVNTYQSQGMDSAVDCDGPLAIAIILGVALGFCLASTGMALLMKKRPSEVWLRRSVFIIVSLSFLTALIGAVPELVSEVRRNGDGGSPCLVAS